MTRVVALSGGVGGAKLALGLCRYLGEDEVSVIANTGDDFEHLGLHVAPDIDTLMYTLSGLNNQETGWGRAGESWRFMEALGQLGGEDWFLLGDKDLATIVERTRRLRLGESLTEVTRHFAETLGIRARILPMSDDPVRTRVLTHDGELAFQHYFVRDACKPVVTGFRFDGAREATPTRAVLDGLKEKTLELVVVCPSNPFISIDPILSVPGIREALQALDVPIIAVSPIVAGAAVKGPTAKMMHELGLALSPQSIAHHYQDLLSGFVLDEQDMATQDDFDLPVLCTATIMNTLDDRIRLAGDVLTFSATLARKSHRADPKFNKR